MHSPTHCWYPTVKLIIQIFSQGLFQVAFSLAELTDYVRVGRCLQMMHNGGMQILAFTIELLKTCT